MKDIKNLSPQEQLEYLASDQYLVDSHSRLVEAARNVLFADVCHELAISPNHSQRDDLRITYDKILDAAVKRFEIDLTRIEVDDRTNRTIKAFNAAFCRRVRESME